MNYSPKNIVLAIFLGMTMGSITIFGLYTLYQDHQNLQAVVGYINQVIVAQQKTAEPVK